MPQSLTQIYRTAAEHLGTHDPAFARLVAEHQLPVISPHTNYFRDLVESIIGQQLSVKAAATIQSRFNALFGKAFPSPEQILTTPHEDMRAVGLSNQKASYVRNLAEHVVGGTIAFERFQELRNDEIIRELTAVKGIGEWTAHMFLIFCMGRLDILATGDLGVRNAIKKLYGLPKAPSPDEVRLIATKNQWHPYESIACRYLWRSLDNEPLTS